MRLDHGTYTQAKTIQSEAGVQDWIEYSPGDKILPSAVASGRKCMFRLMDDSEVELCLYSGTTLPIATKAVKFPDNVSVGEMMTVMDGAEVAQHVRPSEVILWNPGEITTKLWLDSNDLNTITRDSSNLVSSWADKSGNGNDATQSSNALQPSDVNLGDGIEFDGSNDGFVLTDGISETNMSVFVVMEGNGYVVADNNDSRILFYDNPNHSVVGFNNLFWQIDSMHGGQSNKDVTNHDATKVQILEFSKIGSSLQVRVNGVVGHSGYIPASRIFNIDRIGMKWDSQTSVSTWDGNISEIIAVTSTTDREKIEGYLAHKWGLEGDLPSSHNFKSSGPTSYSQ